jgi:hypothetical protein
MIDVNAIKHTGTMVLIDIMKISLNPTIDIISELIFFGIHNFESFVKMELMKDGIERKNAISHTIRFGTKTFTLVFHRDSDE